MDSTVRMEGGRDGGLNFCLEPAMHDIRSPYFMIFQFNEQIEAYVMPNWLPAPLFFR